MPTSATLTPPTLALPDSPAPKKIPGFGDVQHEQGSFPRRSFRRELDLLLLSQTTPSIRCQPQSSIGSYLGANSTVPHTKEAEDEYTLSAYGDISLGEVIVPPSPALSQRIPQPRLRLKVQRPPMPKRRMSYTSVADPLPGGGSTEFDNGWPGSPRPIKNNTTWIQHQPLVSPDLLDSQRQENKSTKNSGASLERLVDELFPRSPSIRLSPPGSPATQATNLPQQTRGQMNGAENNRSGANDTPAKLLQSSPALPPLKEKHWRTRLPPRPPIPKWDV